MNKVTISGDALDTLATVAISNGEDLDTAFRKAIALYVESCKAVRAGNAVGISGNPEALTTRFVGIVPNFP